ncbi:unnamed protein product [Clonostachys rosea]|uniref:RRM domain-containing protein n=1 Tax=Bionectria ochroleuca TaxID=29856 RepID=A0ABY6UMJ9_BIOOC|nr:unnamed protein product [Clonostachys rosea]
MAAEWTYLSEVFPNVIPSFSAWADLRDIAKAISPAGVIPGLASSLRIFGYDLKDIRPRKRNGGGLADNAGDDAVATCALANALLLSANQEKLRFRQQCGQIARIFTKRKGHRTPSIRDLFTATISTGGRLPLAIDSGMKLARYFFSFSPESSGTMSSNMAFLTFKSEDQRDHFKADVDGQILATGEKLFVQAFHKENELLDTNVELEKERRKQRERRRLQNTEVEVDHMGALFA